MSRRRDVDLDRVQHAVEAAERTTAAEIVVSIAPFFIGRVWSAARRMFARLGVANTRRRNGVLVFVVPSRRQVVVLADEVALALVAPAVWRDTADAIAAAFGRGRGTDGLVAGVARLGAALAVPFPHIADDVDELPDRPYVGR